MFLILLSLIVNCHILQLQQERIKIICKLESVCCVRAWHDNKTVTVVVGIPWKIWSTYDTTIRVSVFVE